MRYHTTKHWTLSYQKCGCYCANGMVKVHYNFVQLVHAVHRNVRWALKILHNCFKCIDSPSGVRHHPASTRIEFQTVAAGLTVHYSPMHNKPTPSHCDLMTYLLPVLNSWNVIRWRGWGGEDFDMCLELYTLGFFKCYQVSFLPNEWNETFCCCRKWSVVRMVSRLVTRLPITRRYRG